jgi:hypothetical protein
MMHKQSSGLLVGCRTPILSHLRRTAGIPPASPLWVEIGDAERDGAPDTPDSVCAAREASMRAGISSDA